MKSIWTVFLIVLLCSATFGQEKPAALKSKIKADKTSGCDDANLQDYTVTILTPKNREYYICTANKYRKSRAYSPTSRPADLAEPKVYRNRLIFLAVGQIDLNFRTYRKNRRLRRDFFEILLDVLQIGATTAAAITNGERAKTIIAEGATFLQGSQASVNKHLRLIEQETLFNKMAAERTRILTQIYERANDSDEAYPFERALVDIVAYYEAGTMDGALTRLATDTGAEVRRNELLLERAKQGFGETYRIKSEIKQRVKALVTVCTGGADQELCDKAKTVSRQIVKSIRANPGLNYELANLISAANDSNGAILFRSTVANQTKDDNSAVDLNRFYELLAALVDVIADEVVLASFRQLVTEKTVQLAP